MVQRTRSFGHRGRRSFRVKSVRDRIPSFRELLEAFTDDVFTDLRRTETTGRPLGAEDCVARCRLRSDRMEPEPKDPLEVYNCYKHCYSGKKKASRFGLAFS